MKLNLSIELQSTIKARATTDRTLLLRLSTPSVFGERPALGVLLNFLSHTRTHSRKGTIVISGWKGLIYFAGLKERMYGPVMTWGLAANNEDSIRAGHRQDAISHYTVHITPVRLMSSPSFLGKRGKLTWSQNSPHTRSSFLPVVYAHSILNVFTAILESKQVR
jgi:hypothetical protein